MSVQYKRGVDVNRFKIPAFIVALGIIVLCAIDTTNAKTSIYESDHWTTPANVIDSKVAVALSKYKVQLRKPSSDEVFIRRVYLDMIGTLPTPKETTSFLQNKQTNKRSQLIESLFSRDEYADYWSLKWCDILRVKSEYPINLWPNAVQTYHRWIHDSIQRNQPYDKFAMALLTSTGSNFQDPPANFYRALQGRDSASIAKAVALTFMGTRLERWPQSRRKDMAAFFSQVAYKKTDTWKEEIVYLNPVSTGAIKTKFPNGKAITIPAGKDARQVFADWLIAPDNKWFARNIVNRIWLWTMGRGIISEVDDISPDNPPASPEVLACLEKELLKSHYDLRHIYRLIMNSRTYQQSSVSYNDTSNPKVQFAHYTVRRLDAEVLIDALGWIAGTGVGYVSPTPEPFTFIPKENRTISLADGSITSSFLTTFGRPSRDTGLESERNNKPTDSQCLYLLNSTDLLRKIEGSPQLRQIFTANGSNTQQMIRDTYLLLLSRYPVPNELASADKYIKSSGLLPGQSAADIIWAIINSKEFLYRH
jgi:hypothetical protein